MFEFHGWIRLQVEEIDIEEPQETLLREDRAIEVARAAIHKVNDSFSLVDVRRGGNGLIVLVAHGLRNHHYRPAIELFEQVGRFLPQSYGLLYVYDDEKGGNENEFRVWRLALGQLTEFADPFLSPYIPTVELPL